jgi:hypothetical protein
MSDDIWMCQGRIWLEPRSAGPQRRGGFVGHLGRVIQNRDARALGDSCRGPPLVGVAPRPVTGTTQRNGARVALGSEPPADTRPANGLRLAVRRLRRRSWDAAIALPQQ